ncbi:unnamed protein product [Bubo scandiacus]
MGTAAGWALGATPRPLLFRRRSLDPAAGPGSGVEGAELQPPGDLYQVISAAETIILPSLIGVICSTGLGGNILIAFTVIRTQKKTLPDTCICNLAIADLVHITGMPFLIHQWAHGGEWGFGRPTSSYHHYLPGHMQPVYMQCYYDCSKFGQVPYSCPANWPNPPENKIKDNSSQFMFIGYITYSDVPCVGLLKSNKGSLESCAFDLTSPDDVLWYMLYLTITTFFFPLPLIRICYILNLCYTWNTYQQNKKAGITPPVSPKTMRLTKVVLALVIMSVKHLQWCTNVEVRMAEWDVNVIENTLKSSF